MLNEAHARWLEARRLDIELAALKGVHSTGPRIAVPYNRNGETVYVKAIDPENKAGTRCVPSGIEQTTLWDEDCLTDEEARDRREPLIITEGEWDAVAVKMLGYRYVVSLPSGAASTAEGCVSKAKRVLIEGDRLKPHIAKFDRVIVMTDGDHDGVLMRDAIVEVIGADYCYTVTYPPHTKDANDILRLPKQNGGGSDGLRSVIDNCQPAKSDGFLPFSVAIREKRPEVLSVGIPALNRHLKLSRPEFLVVGGQSGHGKSTITQVLLLNFLCENPNLRVSIFHGEGHRAIPVARAFKWWRHTFNQNTGDPEVQAERNKWLDDRLAFIAPPQDTPPTFEWLLWAMERHALHRKRDIFVVDPWNEILHSRDMRKSFTDHTGECIIKMKSLADRYRLILIVTHHVAKPKERDRPPNRYDLADSAHWVNKADHVVLAWKPKEGENATRIEIAKSKDHDILGEPGVAWFALNSDRFSLDPIQPPASMSEWA